MKVQVLVLLFVGLVLFVSLEIPISSNTFNLAKQKNIPMIEFNGVEFFDIEDGILVQDFNAKNYKKYEEYDIADDVNAQKIDNNMYSIRAKNIKSKDDNIYFNEKVYFEVKNTFKLYGSDMIYEKSKNILSSKKSFRLKQNNNVLLGESFVYNINTKKLNANKIKAKLISPR